MFNNRSDVFLKHKSCKNTYILKQWATINYQLQTNNFLDVFFPVLCDIDVHGMESIYIFLLLLQLSRTTTRMLIQFFARGATAKADRHINYIAEIKTTPIQLLCPKIMGSNPLTGSRVINISKTQRRVKKWIDRYGCWFFPSYSSSLLFKWAPFFTALICASIWTPKKREQPTGAPILQAHTVFYKESSTNCDGWSISFFFQYVENGQWIVKWIFIIFNSVYCTKYYTINRI